MPRIPSPVKKIPAPIRGRSPARRWLVYLIRCRDGSLYTGVTCDLMARLAAHNAGSGAAYTRGRGPVELVYTEEVPDRSTALRREAAIKRLRRAAKIDLAGLRVPDPGMTPRRAGRGARREKKGSP